MHCFKLLASLASFILIFYFFLMYIFKLNFQVILDTPIPADQLCLHLLQKKGCRIFLPEQWSLLMIIYIYIWLWVLYSISIAIGRQYPSVVGWFQAANVCTHLPCPVPAATRNAQQNGGEEKRNRRTYWKESRLFSSSTIPFPMFKEEMVDSLHKPPAFLSTIKRWKAEYRLNESKTVSIINSVIIYHKPNMRCIMLRLVSGFVHAALWES